MKNIARFMICLLAMASAADAAITIYDPPVGEGRYILTPDPPKSPHINGPSIFGVRPGNPFLYAIPATGERPIEFSVENLPAGLEVNRRDGRITGTIESEKEQTYNVVLKAANRHGADEKRFRIVVGETICLTPPLGYNSWNCWHTDVTQEIMLRTAHAMVDKGLKDCGFTYVNIDNAWQSQRGGEHNAIMPNDKFPDMQGMVAEIHGLGLKAGIYSSPWIVGYAGTIGETSDNADGAWMFGDGIFAPKRGAGYHRIGKHYFGDRDARQWAEWGFDYLKYDWNQSDPENAKIMADTLRACGRDIVYSLSNNSPLEYGEDYIGVANAWRTTGDITDAWDNRASGHRGIMDIWRRHQRWAPYCGPGHFPDADMMVIDGIYKGSKSRLTADEQYTHVSLWTLWASPILLGSEIAEMEKFAVRLVSNSEVLEVHQDALGAMATPKFESGDGKRLVLAKPLEDGTLAVGLFNRGDGQAIVSAGWEDLGVDGPRRVRDLWRQKDIGVFEGVFSARVRRHGVVLLRLFPDDGSASIPRRHMKTVPAAPKIGPVGGVFDDAVAVAVEAEAGSTIHYTLDGSEPTPAAPVYDAAIGLDDYAQLRTIAVKDGEASGVAGAEFIFRTGHAPAPDLHLADLKMGKNRNGWGKIQMNRAGRFEKPLEIGGTVYEKGLGTHAWARADYAIEPGYKRFVATAGVDDGAKDAGSVQFGVEIDGRRVARSPILKSGESWQFNVEIPSGAKTLTIESDIGEGGNDLDLGDWVECGFVK